MASTTQSSPSNPFQFGFGKKPANNSFGISDPTDVKQVGTGIVGGASHLSDTGTNLLSEAKTFLDPVLREQQKVATGDRAAVLEAAAPEVATVSAQYDTAFRAAQAGIARGGGRNSVLASIPFQKASAISTTLAKERTDAQKELTSTSLNLAGLGLSAEQGGLQALSSIFGSIEAADAQNKSSLLGALGDIGSTIGKGIFTLAAAGA